MKKFIALALGLALCLTAVACTNTPKTVVTTPTDTTPAEMEETTVPAETEPVQGLCGAFTMPEYAEGDLWDLQETFDQVFNDFTGSAVKPLALLATQVVAGTNYAVLCETTAVVPGAAPQLQIVSIYKDLEGNATVNGFMPFDLNAIMAAEQPVQAEQPMGGGWTLNEALAETANLTEDAKACYEAYFEGAKPEETGLLDIMTLGTQVVAGTNYAVLTRTVSTTEDSTEPNLLYVTVYYKDLEGNVDRTGTYLVDWREWDFQ